MTLSSPPLLLAHHIESAIEPLEKTINKKPPAEQVPGPEAERAVEVVKSALRVSVALARCDESTTSRRWNEYFEKLHTREDIVNLLNQLSLERSGEGDASK